MDTWYYAPYPEPYASCSKLYICEYTLKYFRKKKTLLRHLAKLEIRHPPGKMYAGTILDSCASNRLVQHRYKCRNMSFECIGIVTFRKCSSAAFKACSP